MAKVKQEVKTEVKQKVSQAFPRQKVVRDRLMELNKGIDSGYLEFAELLSEACHRDYHEDWGHGSFKEYCEAELDIDFKRKAYYLMKIWDAVKSLGLPKAEITKLGWAKMKDLSAVLTKENAKELLAEAKKISSRELTERVKIMRKTGSRGNLPPAPVTTKLSLTLGESEHAIIMEALNEAKKLGNTEDLAVAFEMICQDWLAEKGVKPEVTHLEDHIEYLEKVYPVKITFKTVQKKKEKAVEKVEENTSGKNKVKSSKKRTPDPEDAPNDDTDVVNSEDIDSLLNPGD